MNTPNQDEIDKAVAEFGRAIEKAMSAVPPEKIKEVLAELNKIVWEAAKKLDDFRDGEAWKKG